MNAVIAVFNPQSVRGRSRYTTDSAASHRSKCTATFLMHCITVKLFSTAMADLRCSYSGRMTLRCVIKCCGRRTVIVVCKCTGLGVCVCVRVHASVKGMCELRLKQRQLLRLCMRKPVAIIQPFCCIIRFHTHSQMVICHKKKKSEIKKKTMLVQYLQLLFVPYLTVLQKAT
jgi:hypothetical protein